MKVAIGAVAGTIGGPASYAVNLVRALCCAYPGDEFTVLSDKPEAFADFCPTLHVPLSSVWGQPLWDHIKIPRLLEAGDYQLYHATKGVLPGGLPMPAVVTVHDLASYVMPETFSRFQRLHLSWETPRALRRAAAVIVPSNSTESDVLTFFRRCKTPIRVIAEAASPELAPAAAGQIEAWRKQRGLGGICVGYLGTLQPRKNLELLTKAFVQAAGDSNWTLLVAGRKRPGYDTSCLRSDPRIIYLGTIVDAELPLFLGSLACMVSPSSYEGFGLTFVEAMAAGCPVIGLRNSSLPEVVGDAGLLIDGGSATALAAAIRAVVCDGDLAADLRKRGLARAASFSWERAAHETREVYSSVVEA